MKWNQKAATKVCHRFFGPIFGHLTPFHALTLAKEWMHVKEKKV